MSFSRSLLMFMRAAIVVQLVLGIAIWTGHWAGAGMVNLHQGIGTLYVLALWGISVAALRASQEKWLAVFSILWGLLIAGFGMAQLTLIVGDLHWIVRTLHLLIAVVAMPMAERMARAIGSSAAK